MALKYQKKLNRGGDKMVIVIENYVKKDSVIYPTLSAFYHESNGTHNITAAPTKKVKRMTIECNSYTTDYNRRITVRLDGEQILYSRDTHNDYSAVEREVTNGTFNIIISGVSGAAADFTISNLIVWV